MNQEILDSNYQDVYSASKEFFAKVYTYMFGGLAITAIVSYWFASTGATIQYLYSDTGLSTIGYVVMFAPLGVALLLQSGFNKFSLMTLSMLFVAYAVLLGMSLSFIFLIYSMGTLTYVFGITAATYGTMALLGYYTKTDLTKFGGIMYMLFIGIFIASIANVFMGSDTMSWIISFIGIIVFTGLTAYQMQKLRVLSMDPDLQGVERRKLALIGGFQLYILFINLFLSLLRIFGRD